MKRVVSFCLLTLGISVLSQLFTAEIKGQPAKTEKPTIAVFFNDLTGQNRGFEKIWSPFVLPMEGEWGIIVPHLTTAAKLESAGIKTNGEIGPAKAVKIGKLLGVNYLIVNILKEYGETERNAKGEGYSVSVSASLIDTSTGEIVWLDEVRRTVRSKSSADISKLSEIAIRGCFVSIASVIASLPKNMR